MKFNSIVRSIAYIWRAKKIWRMPKKARTLIYHRAGSELFLEYIDQEDVEILDLRGESINVYAFLKCAFSRKLSLANYASEYTSLVRPSVVITFINNDREFYKLKKAHPQLVTIFVQNGWTADLGDIFGYFKNNPSEESYEVDYMLTFGATHGEKFQKYIKGRTIPIGSFMNNRCLPGKEIETGSLVYISQFRFQPSDPDAAYVSNGTTSISYKDFYAAERTLLTYLTGYCERNNLSLQVCGAFSEATGQEYEFYNARIGNANWRFIPRSLPYGSYEVIDSAEYVVFIDSALGYESLVRGKKTAAFPVRGEMVHVSSMRFGWPADLPDNGPFWTNHADEHEFERVMTYITNVSDEEWEHDRLCYVPDLIEYDSGNTRFLKLMRKLGVPLNQEYQTDV